MSTIKGDISKTVFGTTTDGVSVDLYTLRNAHGVEVQITNYGGTVTTWKAPDRHGKFGDIVLGCATLPEYFKAASFFGCLVGRYGNRIAKGQFTLDGVTNTTRRSTTAPTPCMAANAASTKSFGRPRPRHRGRTRAGTDLSEQGRRRELSPAICASKRFTR